jgi:integrase
VIPYGIGRGFDRSRKNGWYIRVQGRKEYFISEELRNAEFDRRVAEARLYGQAATADVTPGQRQSLQEMQQLAGATGYTPMEIFERGLTLVGVKPRRSMLASDAVAQFLTENEARLKDGFIRRRRMLELKNLLKRFGSEFERRDMASIVKADIQRYLLCLGVGPQTRINHARVISRLFSWAADAGVVTANPVVITDQVNRTTATFTADRVARLFKLAPAELVPMLVFQWFAGIRPAATHGLRWEDVNPERRTIAIRPEISKLREPEVIEGLTDEFWAWFERCGKKRGRIAHPNHVKLAKELHHEMGFRGKGKKAWPTDVARHSFASHLYPRLHSIDAVAKVLCHRGSRVTLKHYVAKNVTSEQAEAYFAVLAGIKPS